MKLFSANITSLSDLYIAELSKALDLEETIASTLPRMIEKAQDPDLRQALRDHYRQTLFHVDRMKRLLRGEGSESCKPLHALASNVEDTIKDVTNPQVLDLALIGAAQLMEHYEFATCSTLRAWARTIGQRDAYLVLTSIEADARRTDRLLHELQERLREGSPAMAA